MSRPACAARALCIALALWSAGGVAAPEPPAAPAYTTPDYIRRPPALPPSRDASRAWRLSLAEAIETAIRRNLSLSLEREQVEQTEAMRGTALALWEPQLNAFAQRQFSKFPPSTAQEGRAGDVLSNETTALGLIIREQAPTGTELRLGFTTSLGESMLGTAVLPKISRSIFSIGVAQPLLRGFSFDGHVQTAPLVRARFASAGALEQARLRALLTVNLTENAYWNLVERIKSYEVTAGALELAQKQLDLTRRQIAAGTQPESQLISAEATLAQRELALVQAEVQIDQSSDLLRALLNLPSPDWERPLLPRDTPSFLALEVEVGPALERARASRPELKQVQINYKQVALDLDVARNARLPRLDVTAGYNSVGQETSFAESFELALRGRGRGWNVGLDFTWAPLGVGARAEIRRLESALRQNTLTREQALLDIGAQVRTAVRAIQTADRQVRAAGRSRELSERNLDVEQRRFLSGLTDNFVIAQRQAELAAARQAELSALIQHEKAASDLQLAMGELLEARKVTFSLRPTDGS